MKFKALLSQKQFFSFKGRSYKAFMGELITEDKDLIEYLSAHPYWEALDAPAKKVEKEIEKPAPVRKTRAKKED